MKCRFALRDWGMGSDEKTQSTMRDEKRGMKRRVVGEETWLDEYLVQSGSENRVVLIHFSGSYFL